MPTSQHRKARCAANFRRSSRIITLRLQYPQNPFGDEEGAEADGKSKAEIAAEKKAWLNDPDRDYTYTEVGRRYFRSQIRFISITSGCTSIIVAARTILLSPLLISPFSFPWWRQEAIYDCTSKHPARR